MPSIRSGFGSDFVLKSEKIGIGSETPTNTLDIGGAIKGNLSIAGVATLTSYGGFVAQNQHINKASSIGFGTVGLQTGVGIITSVQYYETETGFTDLGGVHHGDDQYYNTLSEDLVIDEGQILNITSIDMVGFTTIGEYDPHSHQSHVCLGALEEVSVTNHFSVPCGGSNDRKDNPIEGTVRFNDDLNTLEFFNGNEWRQFTYNQGQSGRGVRGGGNDAGDSQVQVMDYITISTTGNAQNFGDLTVARNQFASAASSIRGLFAGGAPGNSDVIDYITIASAGNAIDFGNTSVTRGDSKGVSSSTRGVFGGGFTTGPTTASNVIDYVEIPTLGNALDFGDLFTGAYGHASCGSPTLGIFLGGNSPSLQVIQSITIASKGNSVDYGDCDTTSYASGCSNSVRGIFFGNSPYRKTCQYLNITSNGNSSEFGDAAHDANESSACASLIRGVCMGGRSATSPNGALTDISYVEIASLGDALDFGDLTVTSRLSASLSDSHGGLGGF